jgi:hypothetical protein
MRPRIVFVIVPILLGFAAWMAVQAQQAGDSGKGAADMSAMMEKAKRFTQPGERHKALERFLGKWTTESRLFMGGQPTPPEKGSAEFSWLMAGRWLKAETKGSMMGMPMENFLILGYDNFKQSYVSTNVSSIDTAMTHAEGDMTQSGDALLSYGTLDEYLTGEHDKMVKYAWRFPSKDKLVLEVHDLPIGEKNTKVLEVVYTRAP